MIFFLKKKFEFSILQRFVQICVYSAINGHFCKIKKKKEKKRRKPGHKKALLAMWRVLERPILQWTKQIETHVLCSSLWNQCFPWVARLLPPAPKHTFPRHFNWLQRSQNVKNSPLKSFMYIIIHLTQCLQSFLQKCYCIHSLQMRKMMHMHCSCIEVLKACHIPTIRKNGDITHCTKFGLNANC